jgi:CO/xanthine dehydrogenase Mo-binding subunit
LAPFHVASQEFDVEGVAWEDSHAQPASSNVGDFAPLSFKELAAKKALTGGPTTAAASVNAGGMAPGFSIQFCDVEVDPETGKVTILRGQHRAADGGDRQRDPPPPDRTADVAPQVRAALDQGQADD